MLKRIFVLLVALLCWQGMLKSQWISLDPNSDQIKEADVEILSNTPSGTVIKVNLYGNQRGVEDFPIRTGRVWFNPVPPLRHPVAQPPH